MKKYVNDEFKELIWDVKIPIMISLAFDEKNDDTNINLFVSHFLF